MDRVVIIGAGPAGLTAAYELAKEKKDREIIILEEQSCVGGISKTISVDGNRMDMGGHRFFSKDRSIMEWWKSILPIQGELAYDDKLLKRKCELEENGPDPEKEDAVFLRRHRVSRIYYKHHFFDYPISMSLNTIKNLGVGTTFGAGCSYLHAIIFPKKEDSLENFYINRFGKKLYKTFFEGYTEKLWGRHPQNISADWGAQRVKGLSITAVLKDLIGRITGKKKDTETSLIETFYYPKFGPGQMWEEVARRFTEMGGKIYYNCKVSRFVQEKCKIKNIAYYDLSDENKGKILKEISADAVFSSMPLKNLIQGMEYVPEEVRSVAEGLPYRDFVTVGILVDRLLLKNETTIPTLGNIVPDCWIYVQDQGIKMGRIQIFNNWSPYMVKCPEEKVWIGLEYFCTENDSMWNMKDSKWMELGKSELVKMGILEKDAEIYTTHCERISKAYPAYFDTYTQIDILKEWLLAIPNLYCIGRNGQHRYNNMDHSMLTAMEAVKAYQDPHYDRDQIWNVNTEKEYHEGTNDKI